MCGTRIYELLRPFPCFGSAHRVLTLHVPRSCASSVCTPFNVISFRISSVHLCFVPPIFRRPITSMFSLLHLPLSFSPLVLFISMRNPRTRQFIFLQLHTLEMQKTSEEAIADFITRQGMLTLTVISPVLKSASGVV